MNVNTPSFDAFIFDLGGVILNIDYNLTSKAFKELGVNDFDTIYTQLNQSSLFDDIETGKINGDVFFSRINEASPVELSREQITTAWNAMLLNLPKERLVFLAQMKSKVRTFLLSNTNQIHIDAFTKSIKEQHEIDGLEDYFDKVYYSSNLGMRKPDKAIFDFVIKENGLNPNSTLFIDDTLKHLEGAKKAGLQTYHLQPPETILDLKLEIRS